MTTVKASIRRSTWAWGLIPLAGVAAALAAAVLALAIDQARPEDWPSVGMTAFARETLPLYRHTEE